MLYLHPADEGYGADRILLSLTQGVRAAGGTVAVAVADDCPPGWLSAQLTVAGTPVRRLPLAVARRRYLRPAHLLGYVARLWAARRAVRREAIERRADIVHVNTSALLVGAIIGRPNGARRVWHVHELVTRPRPLAWLFRGAPLISADRVVAVSRAVAANLARARIRTGRIVCVHNGIATGEVVPRTPARRPFTFAFIGRLNRWKGYETFLEAAARVAATLEAPAFTMVGSPPPGEGWRAADLARRVDGLGLGGRLRVSPFLPDVEGVLATVDVVVVPSLWPDPLPTIVLEAMRAGCAVVATDHGGAPEMVVEGVTGLLVPPAGGVAALAEAMMALALDPERTAAMGAAGRRRVEIHFDEARFIAGVLAVYAGVRR